MYIADGESLVKLHISTLARLLTNCALQSWKWQLTVRSWWCHTTQCHHSLTLDKWTHTIAWRHSMSHVSDTLLPVLGKLILIPSCRGEEVNTAIASLVTISSHHVQATRVAISLFGYSTHRPISRDILSVTSVWRTEKFILRQRTCSPLSFRQVDLWAVPEFCADQRGNSLSHEACQTKQ